MHSKVISYWNLKLVLETLNKSERLKIFPKKWLLPSLVVKLSIVDCILIDTLGFDGQNVLLVSFFGPRSSWFGWEKLVFSLGFHLRLWPGSFWGIQHLPELKIAEIFFFSWFPSVMRWSRSPYYWKILRNLVFHSQSGNCGRILMIFTALESSGKSRLRMSQL